MGVVFLFGNGLGSKYSMRIDELTLRPIKPQPPMTSAQARIHAMKNTVERDKQNLRNEQERQRQQRENERKRKEQLRRSSAIKS